MGKTIPVLMKALYANQEETKMFRDEYFVEVDNGAIGEGMRIVRPVVQWEDGEGSPKTGFNVGTRGNGFDEPRWPKDLMTEIVGKEDKDDALGLKRKAEALREVVVGA